MVLLAGCHTPVKVETESRGIVHNSPIEDRGPLTQHLVVGGDCTQGKIAIVDVDGVLLNTPPTGFGSLGENPVSMFREKLDRIAADPCFRAVVVRINSPGGGVTASDMMWNDLSRFRACTGIPVVACLMDVGAGGAYYLATAADHIQAHPTSLTAGIGVILNLYDLQDTMMQFNISGIPIKAGERIDLGSPLRVMDDESEQMLQAIADHYHGRFKHVVAASRPALDPNRDDLFDGRVLLAEEALRRGLIDSIGYVDDAVAIARQISGAHGAPALMLHRDHDPARTPYAVSPNIPLQANLLPFNLPGMDRAQMPTFLYLWQTEPTLERRASGR
jgi:protease-4